MFSLGFNFFPFTLVFNRSFSFLFVLAFGSTPCISPGCYTTHDLRLPTDNMKHRALGLYMVVFAKIKPLFYFTESLFIYKNGNKSCVLKRTCVNSMAISFSTNKRLKLVSFYISLFRLLISLMTRIEPTSNLVCSIF